MDMPLLHRKTTPSTPATLAAIRDAAHPLTGDAASLDPLMQLIGDRPLTLIGEATHGTAEFYHTRAELTKRLIQEKGYAAVAVEADFPDAYRVNRYVRHEGNDESAHEALGDFKRFPTWMWRNTIVRDFVEWLRDYNAPLAPRDRVGFYGLDLYSMYTSMEKVLEYLERMDPDAATRARQRYSCFETYEQDPQQYGYAASFGFSGDCEDDVVQALAELRRAARSAMARDGWAAQAESFYAQQNARLVANAEKYYRSMFGGRVNTWNLRDSHMMDTLDALLHHLGSTGRNAKVAVWEHNSHLGDARATGMSRRGEHNVGQLARERHGGVGGDTTLIGFTTHTGTVSAADDWDGRVQRKYVRPSQPGTWERLFHEAAESKKGPDPFLLVMRDDAALSDALRDAGGKGGGGGAARTRHRRDLSSADRTSEPPVRRGPARSVRRGAALRRVPCARTPRTRGGLGAG